jgi:hypothetical protein
MGEVRLFAILTSKRPKVEQQGYLIGVYDELCRVPSCIYLTIHMEFEMQDGKRLLVCQKCGRVVESVR